MQETFYLFEHAFEVIAFFDIAVEAGIAHGFSIYFVSVPTGIAQAREKNDFRSSHFPVGAQNSGRVSAGHAGHFDVHEDQVRF